VAKFTYSGYCGIDLIKDRVLIDHAITSYDADLEAAGTEASRVSDMFLKPYVTVPLVSVSDQVAEITADFGASIFKRRMFPEDVKLDTGLTPEGINQLQAGGWFAQGLMKMREYIKNFYALQQNVVDSNNQVYNPLVYTDLFKKGIITQKEARLFIDQATVIVNSEIKNVTETRVVINTETDVVVKSKTETDTVREYKTKKQNAFAFVQSDKDGGYKKDT
jgi:hypothetical protein